MNNKITRNYSNMYKVFRFRLIWEGFQTDFGVDFELILVWKSAQNLCKIHRISLFVTSGGLGLSSSIGLS